MTTLAKISLLLVIILVSLSAYLRLAHSGIGCADWPTCYGRIGEPPAMTEILNDRVGEQDNAYQRILERGSKPLAWATPLHRGVAGVLGILVILLNLIAVNRKRHRVISLTLLGLTVFLATLGIQSGSLHNPAVVMGNLSGGFCMLGLLGWMVFNPGDHVQSPDRKPLLNGLALLAMVMLCSQILFGGLTSANFAATACATLPDCNGSYWPGNGLGTAFDLTRSHEVNEFGAVVGGAERAAIHKMHRLGAMLTFVVIVLTGIMAIRNGSRYRYIAIVILALVIGEFSLGMVSVLSGLPIGLAVAHNWLAGLLLLSLLKLLSLNRMA